MLTDFDKALIAFSEQGQLELVRAAALTHDALLLAKRACESVFGPSVDPATVLAVYDRLLAYRAR